MRAVKRSRRFGRVLVGGGRVAEMCALEPRVLMTASPVTVAATKTALTITAVGVADDTISVSVSGTTWTIADGDYSLTKIGAFTAVTVNGKLGNDLITIDQSVTAKVSLIGDAGNDTLVASSGNDTLNGGVGDDSLDGGAGDDLLIGGLGNDTFVGGDGVDTDDYSERKLAVSVSLDGVDNDGQTGEIDSIGADVENINGGAGNDSLTGDSDANVIKGNAGNDTITGNGGADFVDAGAGNDLVTVGDDGNTVLGMAGNDTINSGSGADSIDAGANDDSVTSTGGADKVLGGAGNDTITLGDGASTVLAGDGNDTIVTGAGADSIDAGAGNDSVTSGAGNDTVLGGAGNDTVDAGGDDDLVYGNAGNDSLLGGDGNDTLTGNVGNDVMSGGNGDDLLLGVGGGKLDTLTGGDGDDTFWADSVNTEMLTDVSTDETAAGAVHLVDNFQPLKGVAVSTDLEGQNLTDPTIKGSTVKYRNFKGHALFSDAGPVMTDIEQGQLGDCYFLAQLQSYANLDPAFLESKLVDFHDGTYGVQFTRSGKSMFYRVDADLPSYSTSTLAYAAFGAQGSMWVAIMEKAWAFFRKGQGTYASAESGWMNEVSSSLGKTNTWSYLPSDGNSLLAAIKAQIDAGKSVTVGTVNTPDPKMVGGHAYSVTSVSVDGSGNYTMVVRNPWGVDGYTVADGSNDGLVTLTANQAFVSLSAYSVSDA